MGRSIHIYILNNGKWKHLETPYDSMYYSSRQLIVNEFKKTIKFELGQTKCINEKILETPGTPITYKLLRKKWYKALNEKLAEYLDDTIITKQMKCVSDIFIKNGIPDDLKRCMLQYLQPIVCIAQGY